MSNKKIQQVGLNYQGFDIVGDFRNRLIALQKRYGLNDAAFSRKTGINYTSYRAIIGRDAQRPGKRGPDLTTINALAKNLRNDEFFWLITGEAPPARIAESPDIVFNALEEEGFVRPRADLTDRYAAIPLMKDAAAAGSPAEIDETQTEPSPVIIYKDRAWLPHGLENYTCVHVRGRSMFPILDDGDIVAIDHAERDPKRLDGKLTAFRVNGGITIKWCKYFEDRGQVIGIPENKEEFDHAVSLSGEEIDDGIVGMVRWWWSKR